MLQNIIKMRCSSSPSDFSILESKQRCLGRASDMTVSKSPSELREAFWPDTPPYMTQSQKS